MSYYDLTFSVDYVHATEEPDMEEKRCMRCRGSGLVEVQGQETDCIDCEGMGSVLIPL